MKYFTLIHVHRFGTNVHLLESERPLTEQDALEYLGDDFEPDREESFELEEQTPFKIL